MERDLNYYLSLSYKIELERDQKSNGYMASIPLLRGCMTCGDTMEEALKNLEDAKETWIETAIERNIDIPEPIAGEKEYSGQLRLRIPKSLHRSISLKAKEEGVSMNQYCTAVLASNL